jgi:hypothetical protein
MLGLATKSLQHVWLAGKIMRQDLQRDFATQIQVPGQVHGTHSTGADALEDLVAADDRSAGIRLSGVRRHSGISRLVGTRALGRKEAANVCEIADYTPVRAPPSIARRLRDLSFSICSFQFTIFNLQF